MKDWIDMLEQTRATVVGYELLLESLIGVKLEKGFIVLCDGLPLVFEIEDGQAFNPRRAAPQLATRFGLDDAAHVAAGVKNDNAQHGEVAHVRHAVAAALAEARDLLALLEDHTN